MEAPFLNPGSDEALAAGCICPVMDNNHGKYPPYPPSPTHPEGAWWHTSGCPVHLPKPAKADEA